MRRAVHLLLFPSSSSNPPPLPPSPPTFCSRAAAAAAAAAAESAAGTAAAAPRTEAGWCASSARWGSSCSAWRCSSCHSSATCPSRRTSWSAPPDMDLTEGPGCTCSTQGSGEFTGRVWSCWCQQLWQCLSFILLFICCYPWCNGSACSWCISICWPDGKTAAFKGAVRKSQWRLTVQTPKSEP